MEIKWPKVIIVIAGLIILTILVIASIRPDWMSRLDGSEGRYGDIGIIINDGDISAKLFQLEKIINILDEDRNYLEKKVEKLEKKIVNNEEEIKFLKDVQYAGIVLEIVRQVYLKDAVEEITRKDDELIRQGFKELREELEWERKGEDSNGKEEK
jgi:hypothetical protein